MAETSINEGTTFQSTNKTSLKESHSFGSINCVKDSIKQDKNDLIYNQLNSKTTNTVSSLTNNTATTFKLPHHYSNNESSPSTLQKVNQSLSELNFKSIDQSQLTSNNQRKISIKQELNQDHVNANSNLKSSSSIKVNSGDKEMKNKTKDKHNHQNNSPNNTIISYESQSQPHASTSTNRTKKNQFTWCSLLNKNPSFQAAPVSSFRHVPASELWDNLISNNLKVEIRNKDAQIPPDVKNVNDVYWIASVIKVEGYYLLLRYEGYENDSSNDFWICIYNQILHPVGWSATQRKHLIPPKSIANKQSDWKTYLTKCLIGANTLPSNFMDQIRENLKSNFKVGLKLEVVDKLRISSVRPATISKIIGGRLHVIYDGLEDKDDGFWCHQKSGLIHPVGWAQLVGHELRATKEYAESSVNKARLGKWSENDADFSYFPHLTKQMIMDNEDSKNQFVKGMKLEAIDPLNLSTICCATVTKVLRYNYIMVGIDGMMAKDGSDWFCYHSTSSNIFPVGTCHQAKLPLTPPRDYLKAFNWLNYLKETGSIAAPVKLFNSELPNHGFKKGQYLEAVDLMEPRLICVAMVKEVVGRLLKIHFCGWNDTYDQWVDCESVELFPIGWCEISGYPLEPPREDVDSSNAGLMSSNSFVFDNTIKKRGKHAYKGSRTKKRKRNNLSISDKLNGNSSAKDDDESLMMVDVNTNHQDNCTLFNSTVDSLDTSNDTEQLSIREQTANELTRNSMVTFKPSPLLNSIHKLNNKQPELPITDWSVEDVANYFKNNGCNYSEAFSKHGIDGEKLMRLTREDVLQVTSNKLGPSLKLYALVEELRKCVNFN